jgi:hypothetical protein
MLKPASGNPSVDKHNETMQIMVTACIYNIEESFFAFPVDSQRSTEE